MLFKVPFSKRLTAIAHNFQNDAKMMNKKTTSLISIIKLYEEDFSKLTVGV
jgi:hypothetical protein